MLLNNSVHDMLREQCWNPFDTPPSGEVNNEESIKNLQTNKLLVVQKMSSSRRQKQKIMCSNCCFLFWMKCQRTWWGAADGVNLTSSSFRQRPHMKVMSWHWFCKHMVPVHILNDAGKTWTIVESSPPSPSPMEQVHHLGIRTFDVGLHCCSSAGVTRVFVCEWKRSAGKTLNPAVCRAPEGLGSSPGE